MKNWFILLYTADRWFVDNNHKQRSKTVLASFRTKSESRLSGPCYNKQMSAIIIADS